MVYMTSVRQALLTGAPWWCDSASRGFSSGDHDMALNGAHCVTVHTIYTTWCIMYFASLDVWYDTILCMLYTIRCMTLMTQNGAIHRIMTGALLQPNLDSIMLCHDVCRGITWYGISRSIGISVRTSMTVSIGIGLSDDATISTSNGICFIIRR